MQVLKDTDYPGYYIVTGAPIPGAPIGKYGEGDWSFSFSISEFGDSVGIYAELEDENGGKHQVVVAEDEFIPPENRFFKKLTQGRGTLYRQAAWIREELAERYAARTPSWADPLPGRRGTDDEDEAAAQAA